MDIVLIGSGGYARAVMDIVEKEGKYIIVGLIDNQEAVRTEINGVPVIGSDREIEALSQRMLVEHGIICVADNYSRQRIRNEYQNRVPHFEFVTAVHPNVCVASSVQIGAGTVIMGGVTINANSEIREHCVVNANSSIDHDSLLSDFSSIGPGVNLGGNVSIGHLSYVGIGSAVRQNVVIGSNTVIGGLSFVNKHVGDNELGYSSPYRKVRSRVLGEEYL